MAFSSFKFTCHIHHRIYTADIHIYVCMYIYIYIYIYIIYIYMYIHIYAGYACVRVE